jgi:hypothetical protein
MEPCPCCREATNVRPKILLVGPSTADRPAAVSPWRPICGCQGLYTVDALKPEFAGLGRAAQFVEGLFCDSCEVGYVPEQMAKPVRPTYRYQATPEGWLRFNPDGSTGPVFERISDDPDDLS